MAPSGQRVSRRTIAAGAAWSVPVLTVASAAPAFAVSGCPVITAQELAVGSDADRISLTNVGPQTIPSGTTIAWAIRNMTGSDRTITVSSVLGLNFPSTSFLLKAYETVTTMISVQTGLWERRSGGTTRTVTLTARHGTTVRPSRSRTTPPP